jgi:hypothetical protein
VSKNNKLLVGVLMVVPILIWVFVILYYSVNLPWYDDFDPFPDFLHKWITDTTLSDRLQLLFQPNNEHRMVVGKLITLGYYWLTGQLNFTFLHIIGACFTLAVLYVFWRSFRRSGLPWYYFLPVPFLLLQMQFHLIFLWAITGLQHQPAIFFVCISMYLLSEKRLVWGITAAVCATYAMSSGIFVWPAGFVVLLFRTRYKELILWCVAAVLAIGFYLYGLSAQGNESSIDFLLKNPHLSVLGFFAHLGGLFDFFPEKSIVVRSALPVLMGFVVMIWIAIWLWKQLWSWFGLGFGWPSKEQQLAVKPSLQPFSTFLLGILTFLLVNALIICLLRPRFGFFVMIVSNYKMYPALFLIVAYLTFISSATRESLKMRGLQLATLVSVFIWGISLVNYLPAISERHKYLTVNGYNQEHHGFGLGHVPYSTSAAYVDRLMKDMVRLGVYSYPKKGNALAKQVSGLTQNINPELEITVDEKDSIFYVNDRNITRSLFRNDAEFAFVRNEQHTYFFKMEPHKYSGRNVFRQYDKGADAFIPHSSLLPGTYDLGILRTQNGAVDGGILRKITIP